MTLYHIFANKSNIGDWLSAKGIQSTVPKYKAIELLCDQPFIDDTLDRLRSVGPDDFVIIGGGGLFMDYFAPFWSSFLEVADDIAFGIWGVGCCDLTCEPSLPSPELIGAVVERSRFCYVRDERTRQYLARPELPAPTGCPSLLCLQGAKPSGRGVLHVDNYTTVGEAAFEFMDELGRQFANASARTYRRTNNRIAPANETELGRCLQLYQDSDVVLSSALHGCIIGAALDKKVVAVSGDRKIDAFMQSIGLEDWVCGRDQVSELPRLLHSIDAQSSPAEAIAALGRAQRSIVIEVQAQLHSIDAMRL
jgi:polysaccharide pyruvyl transferase WcaK-like protein